MKSIRNTFSEITSYPGSLEDPIVEYVGFDPLEYIDRKLPAEVRVGAAIGLIVDFCSHADNAMFSGAQKGKCSNSIAFVLPQNFYQYFPEITKALYLVRRTTRAEQFLSCSFVETFAQKNYKTAT